MGNTIKLILFCFIAVEKVKHLMLHRVEGIVAKLDTGSYTGGITYRSYIQGIVWQGYVNNGSMTGTNGQSKRLEAIQIQPVVKGGAAPGSTAMFQR